MHIEALSGQYSSHKKRTYVNSIQLLKKKQVSKNKHKKRTIAMLDKNEAAGNCNDTAVTSQEVAKSILNPGA